MDEKPRKTIDGNITTKLPIGYCKHYRGCLTEKQLKVHRCVRRNCSKLLRYPHKYWEDRAKRKLIKKQDKI